MRPRCRVSVGLGIALTAIWPMTFAPHATAANDFTFLASAQAPVFQITEDQPGATFHPEGEGEYNHAQADLSSAGGHALAAVVWPGAAAGNAGTLAEVLGAPQGTSAINDPVRAEAGTGTGQETDSCCPRGAGTMMTATVKSPGPTADSTLAGGSLGPVGSTGGSTSHASVTVDANNVIVAKAQSAASGVDIGGVFKVGSVSSSATATSIDGAAPTLNGGSVFQNVSIANQPAYVDGGGVHVGAPGKPAGSEQLGLVNQALKNFGMTIYFTEPRTIRIAGTDYYYAASVLVYWQPPGSQNTMTVSMGGAAVGLAIVPGGGITLPGEPELPPAPAIPPPDITPSAALPTDAAPLPQAETPAPVVGTVSQSTPRRAVPVAAVPVAGTRGVGAWPIIVLGLLGGAAAFAGPRLPTLLSAGWKPGCELERLRQAQLRSRS